MNRTNLFHAMELGNELKQLELCRDLIQGGSRIYIHDYHDYAHELPIEVESLRQAFMQVVRNRIDDINEEINEL